MPAEPIATNVSVDQEQATSGRVVLRDLETTEGYLGCLAEAGRSTLQPDPADAFFWPLSMPEVWAARDRFLLGTVEALRSTRASDQVGAAAGACVLVLLVQEFLAVFQARAVTRRFARAGKRLSAPPDLRLIPAIGRGAAPAFPPIIDALRAGPPRPSPWKAPARLLRNLLVADGIQRPVIRRPDPGRDIIALSVGPLMCAHARQLEERVTYCPPSRWFNQPTKAADRDFAPTPGRDLLDAAASGFAAGGERLTAEAADYLRLFFDVLLRLARSRLEGLLASPLPLPRRLWGGSGSDPWLQLLRAAVRLTGGHVTAHDHGAGVGHLAMCQRAISEFQTCDRFVTFTEVQAQSLSAQACRDLIVGPTIPEIVALPRPGDHAPAERPARAVQPRKILFPTTLYCGEAVRFGYEMADAVAFDWQFRTAAWLKEWGYDVTVKPYPAGPQEPAAALGRELSVAVNRTPFEHAITAAELVLFDYPFSTTFRAALESDKAIVLIDFGLAAIRPEARTLLARRCTIVRGWFDENNRAQVAWDELSDALHTAANKRDPAFVERYYG